MITILGLELLVRSTYDSPKFIIHYTSLCIILGNRTIFFDMKAEPNLNGTLTDIIIDNKDNIWASVFGGSKVSEIVQVRPWLRYV